jgi:hypothetical protein
MKQRSHPNAAMDSATADAVYGWHVDRPLRGRLRRSSPQATHSHLGQLAPRLAHNRARNQPAPRFDCLSALTTAQGCYYTITTRHILAFCRTTA